MPYSVMPYSATPLSLVRSGTLFVMACLWIVSTGCGGLSDLETVTGTVTLDGQPLANATVTFLPDGEGSITAGRTDENGRYSLRQSRGVSGAAEGNYIVQISTFSEGDPDGDPPVAASPETIPAKYNQQSELRASVAAGRNTFDFELTSQGEIITPSEDDMDSDDGTTC